MVALVKTATLAVRMEMKAGAEMGMVNVLGRIFVVKLKVALHCEGRTTGSRGPVPPRLRKVSCLRHYIQ